MRATHESRTNRKIVRAFNALAPYEPHADLVDPNQAI